MPYEGGSRSGPGGASAGHGLQPGSFAGELRPSRGRGRTGAGQEEPSHDTHPNLPMSACLSANAHQKSGVLVLINEGQLLSHLNEYILQKYDYQALSLDPPPPRPSAARRLALPALAVAVMAAVALVVMRIRHNRR